MRRSTRARRPSGNARSKRLLAVVGTLAVFGGVVAVTQISSAQDRRTNKPRPASGQCVEPSPGATAPTGGGSTSRTWQNGRWVRNHWGDGQQSVPECEDGKDGTVGTGTAIACPDVTAKLPQVPNRARAEVDRNLAQLQTQIAEADRRLAAEGNKGEAFIRTAILQPLAGKRRAVLDRITTAIDRVGPRPQGLAQLAECQVQPTGGTGGNNGGGTTPTTTPGGGNNGGGNNGGGNNGGGTEPGAGLGVLANDCDESQLQPHDGFQNGNRCVSTEFGEVGAAANNPSLLITQAPRAGRRRTRPSPCGSAPATWSVTGSCRRPGRLLRGELGAQRPGPGPRSLPHRLPDAGQHRPRPRSRRRCPRSSWRPRTARVARSAGRRSRSGAGPAGRRYRPVRLVGR